MKKAKKRISIWILLPILAVMLAAFFYAESKLASRNASLDTELSQVKLERSEQEARQLELNKEIAECSDPTYIENVARTKYGYISKDEIRYVITNPELLYEDGIVPER